jgi:ABC-type branched-subunit amino acid transport system substrate-binding protein
MGAVEGGKMNIPRYLAVGAVAIPSIALALSGTGCETTTPGGDAGTGEGGSALTTIKIGAVFTQSPPTEGLAEVGQQLARTLTIAKNELDRAFASANARVEFDIRDDKNKDDEGKRVTQALIDGNVVGIIGAIGSGRSKELYTVTKPAGLLQISPASTSPDFSSGEYQNGRTFYRTIASDVFQGAAAAAFAKSGPPAEGGGAATPCTKMAIVRLEGSYGQGVSNIVKQKFQADGGQIVYEGTVPDNDPGDKYAAKAQEVADAIFAKAPADRPQCMVVALYEDSGAAVVTAFEKKREATPAVIADSFFYIGTDGVQSQQFIDSCYATLGDPNSKNYAANRFFGTAPDTQPQTPQYTYFKDKYVAQFDPGATDAPPYSANAFDAAILIALGALQGGDVTDRAKVLAGTLEVSRGGSGVASYGPDRLALAVTAIVGGAKIKYQGASGDVIFSDTGDVLSAQSIWRTVKRGTGYTFETIQRIPLSDLQ